MFPPEGWGESSELNFREGGPETNSDLNKGQRHSCLGVKENGDGGDEDYGGRVEREFSL